LCVVNSVIERPDALPETIVAVFPPSDLSVSGNHRADVNQFYQASDSTISSIKCVMSTVLFLAVVTIIIVVAFVKNPGMWLSVQAVEWSHCSSSLVKCVLLLLHCSSSHVSRCCHVFTCNNVYTCTCFNSNLLWL